MAQLRLIYRSYGGENEKRRPEYFSKLLTLTSFVRAAAAMPTADVVFLNDGPIPSERLEIMQTAGRVCQIDAAPVGMRASYWHALRLPTVLGWSDDDVVNFAEDDYLWREDAFIALADAADHMPEAGYFALYHRQPSGDHAQPNGYVSRGWRPQPDRQLGPRRWHHVEAIASTFSARVGVLRQDLRIFRQGMFPFRRRYLDTETCLVYQGQMPYHGVELVTGLPGDFVPSLRGVVRTVVLVPFRLALNLRALQQTHKHFLYALEPTAATHLEIGVMSKDQDWSAEVESVAWWARGHGLGVAADQIQYRSSPSQ